MFRIGDVIVLVNNVRCEGMEHMAVIDLLKAGDTTTIHIQAGNYPYEAPGSAEGGGLARTNSYVIANAGDESSARAGSVSPSRSSRSNSPSRLPIRQDSPNPPVAQMELSQRSINLIADGSAGGGGGNVGTSTSLVAADRGAEGAGTPIVTPNASPVRPTEQAPIGVPAPSRNEEKEKAGCCAIL